jgi:hypothetical protein
MIDLIYFMFYCSAGNDGTKSKHEMVAYGMELISTQLFIFLSMILLGACNLRFNSFITYVVILLPIPFISYYIINGYYIKSGKYNTILEKYATTSKRTRTLYKAIVILLFIISFALLFVGGIIMSYLLSLYE